MRGIHRIKYLIGNHISKYNYNKAQLKGINEFFISIPSDSLPSLRKEEKSLIKELWRDIIPNLERGYHAYRVLKKYCGYFSAQFVPQPYFYPFIIRSLNPTNNYISLQNKCLYDSIFVGIKMPTTILKRISGNLLTRNDEIISYDCVSDYIKSQHSDLIIKPSKDTSKGIGFKQIASVLGVSELNEILDEYKSDFIIQEQVKQSGFTAQFNPTSLNTMRITTLYINNELSFCSALLKMGAKGKITDNAANGALWVGINREGKLNNWGIDNKCHIANEHNNVSLSNKVIPNFSKVIDLAFNAHKKIPMCGLVGWDIALDEDNEPILIEANLWWPSVSFPQILNGPYFSDRTIEVIDYVKSHKIEHLGISHKI